MGKIRCVGVLTSGGDAPGMNAAIRAVTRSGICNGFKIKGIYRGYDGLIHDEVKPFTTEDVSNIIQTGGTILRTARSKEFQTAAGRKKAYETLRKESIDALVVIGGNGSLTGAMMLAEEYDFPCIGLPGTIDNDLYGTDSTPVTGSGHIRYIVVALDEEQLDYVMRAAAIGQIQPVIRRNNDETFTDYYSIALTKAYIDQWSEALRK